jgi:hypothetical protein
MELSVGSRRPLADAARLLEERFHRVVTYEDTPYAHPDDTVRDEAGRLIPRGGRITVQYGEADDPQGVISNILEAYARSNLPGRFAVEHRDGDYHIVPRAFRDARGAMEARTSLLDTPIALVARGRDALRVMEEIAHSVSRARGETVALGTVPINRLAQHRVASDRLNGSARDLLVGLFRETGTRSSWQLLNDPGSRDYFLNIHDVPDP